MDLNRNRGVELTNERKRERGGEGGETKRGREKGGREGGETERD